MSEYQRVLGLIYDEPMAIAPDKLDVIEQVLLARISHGPMTDEEIRLAMGTGPASQRQYEIDGGVAVIPVFGVVSKAARICSRVRVVAHRPIRSSAVFGWQWKTTRSVPFCSTATVRVALSLGQ